MLADLPIATRARGAGQLQLAGESAGPAPRISSRVEARITGVIVRTRVVQRFRNPADRWLDAVYAFPLPEGAAVDSLRVRSGERLIVGRIEERRAARARYERARDAGRRAALLEQDRTNWFRTAVSAIEPHGEVEVAIEYQEWLRPESDGLRWRLPLAAPHHTEAATDAPAADGAATSGASEPRTPAVEIRIDLEAGFPLEALDSPTHALETEALASDHVRLGTTARGDRDLELAWRWRRQDRPLWRLLAETTAEGETALLMMLLPPRSERERGRGERGRGEEPDPRGERGETSPAMGADRDLVLTIDTSGSMAGAPIRHARVALAAALSRLRPSERFDVVAFAEEADALFGELRPATASNLEAAQRFVAGLEARGGTDIAAALDAVLTRGPEERDERRLRQVVFVSDGAAPDEEALLARLSRGLGATRFHAVAIGSAPNGAFMRAAARIGRGSVTFVAARSEVGERLGRLFEKLESPVVTDLELRFHDPVEMWPPKLPDLHAGEPVVATALVPRSVGDLVLRGRVEGRSVEWRTALAPQREARGIARLFARHKIQALTDSLAAGASPSEVEREVLATALRHQIVSSRTSLVAVDRSPRRPPSAPNARSAAHAPWVSGSDPALEMIGVLPAGATPGPLLVRAGLLLCSLAGAGGAWLARRSARC
ncbi:MAG: VIT domain-containing protein [Myxococcota bacterium]